MEHRARVVVPGDACVAPVHSTPMGVYSPSIFLTRALRLVDYTVAINSIGIICEACEPASHIAVVCRILGIPVLALENATQLLSPGQVVALDPQVGAVVYGAPPNAATARPHEPFSPAAIIAERALRYQVSIVDMPELITTVNALGRRDVEQFFLRAEFIWVAQNLHPFAFLCSHGPAAVTNLLVDHLAPLARRLENGQVLNFRGLDIRSDQWQQFDAISLTEPNPQLGLHGIRQLLLHEPYLLAELQAVDRLFDMGFRNVIYALPFLTLEAELEAVRRLCDRSCRNRLPFGVFVETPSAVSELPYLLQYDPVAVYVGTKDLGQLILAADRDNRSVAHILDLTSRPVLMALSSILAECGKSATPVFIFAFVDNLVRLLTALPEISRVSLAAADYLGLFRD